MAIDFTERQIKELHRVQLEILIEFDRICRKNNIKYIISGGTLLGAVRNQGFIPWDDDVDVRMDRNEYDRFCSICNDELDKDKFFFQTYKTDPYYPWFYAKIKYKNSKYTRTGQEHIPMQDGIFLDIMPGDGVPNTLLGKKIISYVVYGLKKFLYAAVGKKSEKLFLNRLWYTLLDAFPRNIIFFLFEKLAQRFKDSCYSQLTCYSFTSPGQTEYTERSWHLETVELPFEGHKFYGPKEYDKWLAMTYGKDYMTPPPKEKQTMHLDISEFSIEGIRYD